MRNAFLFLIAITALLLPGRLNAAEPATKPATQPTKLAAERADALKAELKNFTLSLTYTGEEAKPFYRLYLTVPAMRGKMEMNPFYPHLQITEAQAGKIIDYLALEGFLDQAFSGQRLRSPIPPKGSYYTLMAGVDHGGNAALFEQWLPWNATLITRLEGLRKVLDGDAADSMDLLLNRLEDQREAWAKEAAGK